MMTPQWTVLCDNDTPDARGHVCCATDQCSGGKRHCIAEFKRAGWTRKKSKWLCPECSAPSPISQTQGPAAV